LLSSLRRTFRDTAETVIAAVLIFVALQATTQSFEIDGRSMVPTFLDHQRVLVNRFVYTRSSVSLMGEEGYLFHGPQRGDVIVFKPPTNEQTDFVKRVIGVPGDVVDIRDGEVYVNGERTDYVDVETDERSFFDFPITVPDNEYFVLGDNRRASNDSRNWGYVHANDIVGRAWVLYWPIKDFRLFG
jgi:signal peptidase I